MKFLKENSYDIVRLYINQIGITIFSLVLYTSISFIEDTSLNLQLKVALSVFASIFYFALLYTASWEYGAKDRIKIDSGRIKYMPFKGTLISLAANAPNFILAIFTIITMAIYLSAGIDGFNTAFAIFNLLLRFTNSMFLGLLQGIFSFITDVNTSHIWQSVGYLVMPLFSVLVTQIGYTFGEKNIRIFSAFAQKPDRE